MAAKKALVNKPAADTTSSGIGCVANVTATLASSATPTCTFAIAPNDLLVTAS